MTAAINMSDTLNKIIMMDNRMRSCVHVEIGLLKEVRVFDVSFNKLLGPLSESVSGMVNVE